MPGWARSPPKRKLADLPLQPSTGRTCNRAANQIERLVADVKTWRVLCIGHSPDNHHSNSGLIFSYVVNKSQCIGGRNPMNSMRLLWRATMTLPSLVVPPVGCTHEPHPHRS